MCEREIGVLGGGKVLPVYVCLASTRLIKNWRADVEHLIVDIASIIYVSPLCL